MANNISIASDAPLGPIAPIKNYLEPLKSRGLLFMWLFVVQDAALFLGLIAASVYIRKESGSAFELHLAPGAGILNSVVLTISGYMVVRARRVAVAAIHSQSPTGRRATAFWLALSALGGLIFLAVQSYEYHALISTNEMRMPRSLFDATFFILTGFHGMHVLAGVLYLGAFAIVLRSSKELKGLMGRLTVAALVAGVTIALFALCTGPLQLNSIAAVVTALAFGLFFFAALVGIPWLERRNTLDKLLAPAALYWQFVDAVWIVLFVLIYVLKL